MSANTRFYFKPGENERIETNVTATPDCRSAICGVVRDTEGRPVPDALCMLFSVGGSDALAPAGQGFTDDAGQFVFGPLTAGQLYMIKVYKDNVKWRTLEIAPEG